MARSKLRVFLDGNAMTYEIDNPNAVLRLLDQKCPTCGDRWSAKDHSTKEILLSSEHTIKTLAKQRGLIAESPPKGLPVRMPEFAPVPVDAASLEGSCYCARCQEYIGVLRLFFPGTLFGIEEDLRILSGQYGLVITGDD